MGPTKHPQLWGQSWKGDDFWRVSWCFQRNVAFGNLVLFFVWVMQLSQFWCVSLHECMSFFIWFSCRWKHHLLICSDATRLQGEQEVQWFVPSCNHGEWHGGRDLLLSTLGISQGVLWGHSQQVGNVKSVVHGCFNVFNTLESKHEEETSSLKTNRRLDESGCLSGWVVPVARSSSNACGCCLQVRCWKWKQVLMGKNPWCAHPCGLSCPMDRPLMALRKAYWMYQWNWWSKGAFGKITKTDLTWFCRIENLRILQNSFVRYYANSLKT